MSGSIGGVPGAPARLPGRCMAWLVLVVACVGARPAEAQRLGRRFRAPPAPPRQTVPPAAPASPAASPRPAAGGPGQAAPGAARDGNGKAPARGDRRANGTARERPQTTAAPAPGPASSSTAAGRAAPPAPAGLRAAEVAWGGVVPFSAEWRRVHPAAWTPDEDSPTVRLSAGEETPTTADQGPVDPPELRTEGSVLAAGGADPVPLLFPDDAPAAPAIAADGTVSVLERAEGSPSPALARVAVAPATGGDDARGVPWLPLGTFAALPAGGAEEAVPHVFLELSLHRDGRVRGNYFDALSETVQPVAGRLDRQTGTVSWRVGRGPECTTPAEGLTSGRAEVRVAAEGGERSWTLIGLE